MRCDAMPLLHPLDISNISDDLDGALYRNTVHRHEPPITKSPVLVLHKDEARQFIVISKPGSVVSHPLHLMSSTSVSQILGDDLMGCDDDLMVR
jgi:23S rRNA-/tRNA-specific pseudouridylate synthase